MVKTREQLITENEELRSRLAETEETLLAIQSGEVDAIMVFGRKGEQVYSISSAETPYRNFIEEMNEGAVTLSREGIILYCNQKFADFVNEKTENVIGSSFNRFIVSDNKSIADYLLAHQSGNRKGFLIVSLINSLHLKLSFHQLPASLGSENYMMIATDITDMKKKEKELLDLHRLLKQRMVQLQDLRIELINARIELNAENDRLKAENKKLVKEIGKYKLVEAGMSQKLKGKF